MAHFCAAATGPPGRLAWGIFAPPLTAGQPRGAPTCTGRYLASERITESDVRLFVTLVRLDALYFGHFKCNRQQIADYPALSNYLRELYQLPGIAETVSLGDIKDHYYRSHLALNPSGIVPRGPALDFDAPHDRALLPGMSLRSA